MGALLAFLIMIVPITLYRGLVISWLWEWFVTPLGLQSISIMHGAGISLIVAALTFQLVKSGLDDSLAGHSGAVRTIVTFIVSLILNTLWFGIGFVISFFI